LIASRLRHQGLYCFDKYDQIDLLKPGLVANDSGYRYYKVAQLQDMLLISRLKQYQFSLPEIAAIIAKNDHQYLADRIRAKQNELKKQINYQNCLQKGIHITPVKNHCIAKGRPRSKLLIGYGHLEPEKIRNGVQLLHDCMEPAAGR
jgi:DNA-binding transcriptional MerR regulator